MIEEKGQEVEDDVGSTHPDQNSISFLVCVYRHASIRNPERS